MSDKKPKRGTPLEYNVNGFATKFVGLAAQKGTGCQGCYFSTEKHHSKCDTVACMSIGSTHEHPDGSCIFVKVPKS